MITYVRPVEGRSVLELKFNRHIKISTLIAENFELWTDEATPREISDAFKPITINSQEKDYNQTSRVLWLNLQVDVAKGDYTFMISGVANAAGSILENESYSLKIPLPMHPDPSPDEEPVFIEDHSIVGGGDLDFGSIGDFVTPGSSSEFFIEETDPIHGDYFVETDYNDGRMAITFSSMPDVAYLNNHYIKVQRKKNQIAPIRWETIPVRISIAAGMPVVYLDFPAIDDDTTFMQPGHTYFEDGYVYRVKFSKNMEQVPAT